MAGSVRHRVFFNRQVDMAADRRRNYMAMRSDERGCDVLNCHKPITRYVGSTRMGWLYFCSKHSIEALRISEYLAAHPKAKFPIGQLSAYPQGAAAHWENC